METILIVDDEKNYPLILGAVLEEAGYETLTAHSGMEALEIVDNSDVDLVLTDMKMTGMDGIRLLEKIKERNTDLPVILMTAYATVDKAVEAMQKGAYSYLVKPFDNDRLIIYAQKAMATYKVVKENQRLRDTVASQYRFGNLIGKSKVMQDVYETIRKVAPTTAPVLIEGESGTGKELVAKSIHFNSMRKDKAFVAVNCTAFSENLLESEFFGHEKGAFTGAVAMKKGRFELAEGGTLFLDEIGELSPNLQVKLLRVLQEKVLERVGGTKPIHVDFRLIAATNRMLKNEMLEGTFRKDLYYRLNVVRIVLPPLRRRQEDIHMLVNHFIKKYKNERGGESPIRGIDQAAERMLFEYDWPGNVRELENAIERAMILCPGPMIRLSDLPKNITRGNEMDIDLASFGDGMTLPELLANVESQMIRKALARANNVQAHAAKLLGIGKSGLNQKIKKYRIDAG